jgi:hypothetical protein
MPTNGATLRGGSQNVFDRGQNGTEQRDSTLAAQEGPLDCFRFIRVLHTRPLSHSHLSELFQGFIEKFAEFWQIRFIQKSHVVTLHTNHFNPACKIPAGPQRVIDRPIGVV